MARPPLNSAATPRESRLKVWPDPPPEFREGERASWARLGRAVMAGPGITEADLLLAERLARVMAQSDAVVGSEEFKPTVFASLARLEKEMLIQLGLSLAARKGIVPPDPNASAREEAEGVLDGD